MPDIDGHPTRVERAGHGSPVLWLHDSWGNRWTQGHELLTSQFEIVAPALPGFEDEPEGIDGPEDVVFWLLDLLQALDLDHPALLGCGLGGWMAAEFAVRYPRLLSRLILVDAYGLSVEGALAADEFGLTPAMLRPLAFDDSGSTQALNWLPDQPPPEETEARLRARVAAARLAWQFPYSRKLRGRLPRAHMPALVVWGENDLLVPVQHAEAYAAALPSARQVRISAAAHFPYVEAPEQFADAVAGFLSG